MVVVVDYIEYLVEAKNKYEIYLKYYFIYVIKCFEESLYIGI